MVLFAVAGWDQRSVPTSTSGVGKGAECDPLGPHGAEVSPPSMGVAQLGLVSLRACDKVLLGGRETTGKLVVESLFWHRDPSKQKRSRESWGLLSSHCRAKETSPRLVSRSGNIQATLSKPHFAFCVLYTFRGQQEFLLMMLSHIHC